MLKDTRQLNTLLNDPSKKITEEQPNQIQVWFWDESGFSLKVIRRKNWGLKGNRKKVSGQRSKGRINVIGGLR